jgi:hypothetical protein
VLLRIGLGWAPFRVCVSVATGPDVPRGYPTESVAIQYTTKQVANQHSRRGPALPGFAPARRRRGATRYAGSDGP